MKKHKERDDYEVLKCHFLAPSSCGVKWPNVESGDFCGQWVSKNRETGIVGLKMYLAKHPELIDAAPLKEKHSE